MKLYILLILLGLTIVSILINGYHYEYADQDIYFAYLPIYTNAHAYPSSDLMMLGKQTGGNYYTYLWYLLLPFFNLFGRELTCFITHLINVYLIFLALYILAKQILASSVGAYSDTPLYQKLFCGISLPILLALVLFITRKFVAGVSMVTIEPYLHPRNVALVLLLFAISSFIAGRRVLAFSLVGFAANIHIISAGIIAFCFLISIGFEGKPRYWKRILLAWLALIVCSSPIWVWWEISRLSAIAIPAHISNTLWLAILQYRASYLFPQLWDRIGWLALLSILFMFMLGYYSTKQIHPGITRILGFIFGILILIAIGIIFSELIPIPIILGMQPMRSIQFLVFISVILIVPYLLHLWQLGGIGKILSIGIGIGIIIFEPRTLIILFIISGVYKKFLAQVRKRGLIQWAFGIILVITIPVALLLFWTRISSRIPQWINFSRGESASGGFKQTILSYIQFPGSIQPNAWQEVQLWAKEHSQPESIWITPFYLSGFRLRSQRSTVVEWKDGAMTLFSPVYAEDWWFRLNDFGIGFQSRYELQPSVYHNLSYSEFLRLAEKYHAEYLVVEKPKTFPAKLVYSNSQFKVFLLPNTTDENASIANAVGTSAK